MKLSCLRSGVVAGALLVALAPPSRAAVTGVTAAADLGSASTVSWAALGPAGTSVPSPATAADSRGNTVTATSSSGGSLLRLDEGTNFNGNFTYGSTLLYLTGGSLTLGFASPVSGGGLQVQANSFGDFTATVTAFGAGGVALGSFTRNGFSDDTEDGSAIFLGLRDTTADIAQLSFTVGGGFAAGNPSIGPGTAVPEPSTSLLAITAVLGLVFARRATRKATERGAEA